MQIVVQQVADTKIGFFFFVVKLFYYFHRWIAADGCDSKPNFLK